MADDEPTAADELASAPSVEGELQAADQTRNTAKLIATAIAAIPALGLASSIIRPPGEAGFDPTLLSLGLGLAAAGLFVALIAFGNVIRPVAVANKDLKGFDLTRVPAAPSEPDGSPMKGEGLLAGIEQARSALVGSEPGITVATVELKEAEAIAAGKEALALPLEAIAKDSGDKDLEKRARIARAEADAAAASAIAARARLEGSKADIEPWRTQFTRLSQIRRDVVQLRSADSVRNRLYVAVPGLALSFALITAGATALALAPKAKADPPFTPSLATINLSDHGVEVVGCSTKPVYAIRTGGTDDAPIFITLPTPDCPVPRTFEFKAPMRSGELGGYSPATLVPIPTPSPTPSPTPTPS